jgi:hypothetical protein
MQPCSHAAISLALAAAVSVASALGLTVNDTIVLQNSNRLAVRLVRCDVLAHVVAPVRRNHEVALFELGIARELEGAGGLVGVLDSRVEQIVRVRDGFAVTFWKNYETLPGVDNMAAEYALALTPGCGCSMWPHHTSPTGSTKHKQSSGTVPKFQISLPLTGSCSPTHYAVSGERSSTAVRTSSCCTANRMPATS